MNQLDLRTLVRAVLVASWSKQSGFEESRVEETVGTRSGFDRKLVPEHGAQRLALYSANKTAASPSTPIDKERHQLSRETKKGDEGLTLGHHPVLPILLSITSHLLNEAQLVERRNGARRQKGDGPKFAKEAYEVTKLKEILFRVIHCADST